MAATKKGVCKWFSPRKGYGFITPDGENAIDLFVHFSNLKSDGFRTLYKDQRVSFTVGKDKNGKDQASEVTAEDGSLLVPRPRDPTRRRRQPASPGAEGQEPKPQQTRSRVTPPKTEGQDGAAGAAAGGASGEGRGRGRGGRGGRRRRNRRGGRGGRGRAQGDAPASGTQSAPAPAAAPAPSADPK
eukprot:c8_g1_i1.p1 GENE.c8_g1_i1~~c8_g1_i1.p1  ORF type:complete len:186 (-),score=26.18 c8_g1_i1:69-626(-)